jgi:hypothetical protein
MAKSSKSLLPALLLRHMRIQRTKHFVNSSILVLRVIKNKIADLLTDAVLLEDLE